MEASASLTAPHRSWPGFIDSLGKAAVKCSMTLYVCMNISSYKHIHFTSACTPVEYTLCLCGNMYAYWLLSSSPYLVLYVTLYIQSVCLPVYTNQIYIYTHVTRCSCNLPPWVYGYVLCYVCLLVLVHAAFCTNSQGNGQHADIHIIMNFISMYHRRYVSTLCLTSILFFLSFIAVDWS